MTNIYIDPNWTYKEIVFNIRAIKKSYDDTLRSFSYHEIKQVVKFKRELRDKIYAMKFAEKQKDKLWEYMNDFIPFTDFFVENRQKIK